MLTQLEIANFRGFRQAKIEDLGQINLFVGANNTGKTTLLEALFVLQGHANIDLPLTVSALRGLSSFDILPMDIWGWLFNDKDIAKKISIKSFQERDRHRALTISLVPRNKNVSSLTSKIRHADHLDARLIA